MRAGLAVGNFFDDTRDLGRLLLADRMPGAGDLAKGAHAAQRIEQPACIGRRRDEVLRADDDGGRRLELRRIVEQATAGEQARGLVVAGTANTGHGPLDQLQNVRTACPSATSLPARAAANFSGPRRSSSSMRPATAGGSAPPFSVP